IYKEERLWMHGKVAAVRPERVLELLPAVAAGLLLALLMMKPLSAHCLGDDVARALGHRPGLVRAVVSLAVTLLTAAAVAMAGPLSFLRLYAPHLSRAIAGPRLGQQLGHTHDRGCG